MSSSSSDSDEDDGKSPAEQNARELEEEEDLLATSSESSSSDNESEGEGGSGKNTPGEAVANSDDDSDDGSSPEQMDVEEEQVLAKLAEINEKLLTDPNSYELQVEKIQTLKQLGDFDKLREARTKLNEGYPLSPELWLSWIEDEMGMSSEDPEDTNAILALFERAVKDYLSIDIWIAYAQFCVGKMGEDGGHERCRDVFERALSICGLHVIGGDLLWEMYRDFEAALLGSVTAEHMEEQEARYITLCRRQLSVPLQGMEAAFENISSKIELDTATETAYQKALEKLQAVQPWEAKLAGCSEANEKLEVFKLYIDSEKKAKSNPARIVCLFERAVADLPLMDSLWLDYIDYVSQNLQIQDVVIDTAIRASRNCPWILSIWTKYMSCEETYTCDKEKLREIFEKAVIYCTTGKDAAILWLQYLGFLRRRIDFDNVVEAEVQLFNKTISAAEDHLLQFLADPDEDICEIILLRARTATHIAKSLEASKDLWNDIFQRGYGKQFVVWMQYLLLENKYGSPRSARKHFERGLNSVQDNAQSVCDLWLSYERDFGDLKSVNHCLAKIGAWKEKMAKIQFEVPASRRENDYKLKRPRNDFHSDASRPKKSRSGLGYSKASDDRVDGDWKSFKARQELDSHRAEAGGSNDRNAKYQPNVAAPKRRDAPTEEKVMKFDPKDNYRTAFLSNLPYSVGEEEIGDFLATCGPILQIRLIKDLQGRSKGFAYVTFESQDAVKQALAKDREPLGGRPAFVSECAPDKNSRPTKFKQPITLEKNKLFVKGLPLTTTKDQVQILFEAFGEVKDVRLITLRSGQSKGMAYIDFASEEHAAVAMQKVDGIEYQGNVLSVAVSNPPKRPSKDEEPLLNLTRRTAKPFVPRSVQVKVEPKLAVKPTSTEPKVAMSNEEFRQFLKPAPVKPNI